MKRILAILGILLLLFVGYIWFFYFRGRKTRDNGPKPKPIAVSKHTPAFNSSADALLTAYYDLAESFVNWDTDLVNKQAAVLKTALDSLKVADLQKDTIIYETSLLFLENAKTETNNILQQPGLDKKKAALNNLTDNLRTLLITVKYDQAKVYYQECPMAFDNGQTPGYWLSPAKEVRNPYMGTKHPEYKDKMLECGGPKDTINFIQADTTQQK
ncbi:MAG: DUF3347 domain-containing protein [Chitinophagaceae bacterium]|nr:DUF3347 domain-containing protein [Chitinophagaceae bacterium]